MCIPCTRVKSQVSWHSIYNPSTRELETGEPWSLLESPSPDQLLALGSIKDHECTCTHPKQGEIKWIKFLGPEEIDWDKLQKRREETWELSPGTFQNTRTMKMGFWSNNQKPQPAKWAQSKDSGFSASKQGRWEWPLCQKLQSWRGWIHKQITTARQWQK